MPKTQNLTLSFDRGKTSHRFTLTQTAQGALTPYTGRGRVARTARVGQRYDVQIDGVPVGYVRCEIGTHFGPSATYEMPVWRSHQPDGFSWGGQRSDRSAALKHLLEVHQASSAPGTD